MALPIEYRKKIAKSLPWGARAAIADKLGVSRQGVSQWFVDGKNQRIELALLDYILSHCKEDVAKEKKRQEVIALLDKLN